MIMQQKMKWILLFLLLIWVLIPFSGVIPLTNHAQGSSLLSQTRTVEGIMNKTQISGSYENSSVQIPLSTPTPQIAIPKSYTADLSQYESKENISLLTDPTRLQLDPIYETTWQNESFSNFTMYHSDIIAYQSLIIYGNYTSVWAKDEIIYDVQSFMQPKQRFLYFWTMNMTIPFSIDFLLYLRYNLLVANKSMQESTGQYLKTGNVSIYNYQYSRWDLLRDNIGYLAGWLDDFFLINYAEYVSATTHNITVRICGGEGENGTAVYSAVRVDFAGAFVEQVYRCQNYSGYWESDPIQLTQENAYYYDNFSVGISNTSYKEDIDQFQPLNNIIWAFGDGVTFSIGQSFMIGENNLVKITIQLHSVGNPMDGVLLNVYNAIGDLPVGTSLATDFIPGMAIPATGMLYNFTVPVHLIIGNQYVFILSRIGPPDPINYYQTGVWVFGNPYPPGKGIWNNGFMWIVEDAADMRFITWYFVDSYMTFEYRNSTDGMSWSDWTSISCWYTNFDLHLQSILIQQNLTQYFQIRIDLNSNHPAFLPIVYNITLFYISYDWNYTILEFDEFQYTKLDTPQTICEIDILISLEMNTLCLPNDGWIKIYNVELHQWDFLLDGIGGGLWVLKGANLTTYYNSSLYLLFWYLRAHDPINLQKIKNITFFWNYYCYDELDQFDFTATNPILDHIELDTHYTILYEILEGNISLLNTSSNQWIAITFGNYTDADIPFVCYNGSIYVRTAFLSIDMVIEKTVSVTIFYTVSVANWWLWIVIGLVLGSIAAIFAYGWYQQAHPERYTVVGFSHS